METPAANHTLPSVRSPQLYWVSIHIRVSQLYWMSILSISLFSVIFECLASGLLKIFPNSVTAISSFCLCMWTHTLSLHLPVSLYHFLPPLSRELSPTCDSALRESDWHFSVSVGVCSICLRQKFGAFVMFCTDTWDTRSLSDLWGGLAWCCLEQEKKIMTLINISINLAGAMSFKVN